MKKLITLATAILMVVGFTMTATAAEMSITCENCPKAKDPGIISPGAVTVTQSGTSGGCFPFQYESGDGYCDDANRILKNTINFGGGVDKSNRIIFTLCDCTRGTFLENDPIPVRMTVLTDGVYWGWAGLDKDLDTNIDGTIRTSLNAIVSAVACPVDYPENGVTQILSAIYPITGPPFDAINYTFQLENGALYRSTIGAGSATAPVNSQVLNNAGSVTGNWSTGAAEYTNYNWATRAAAQTCTLTADQRVKVITASNIYTVKAGDVASNLQKFQIVLPFMMYDVNEITLGDSVTVLIEYGKVALCGPCFACECQRTVGVLGACPSSGSECMYFPFVFTNMAPWDAGIVITNLGGGMGVLGNVGSNVAIADMTAKFTYVDKTGAKFTYTKSDFDASVWAFMVGAFAANLSGTPAAGNGWLFVETNFAVDGYQFLTNGTFGAGTLARGCCASGLCH